MDERMLAGLMLADTVLINIGLAVMVGSCASLAWMRRADSPWALRTQAQARVLLRAAAGLSALSSLLLLWMQAASMAEVPLFEAWTAIVAVLSGTQFGHAWLAGFVAAMAVLGMAANARVAGSSWKIVGALTGIVA